MRGWGGCGARPPAFGGGEGLRLGWGEPTHGSCTLRPCVDPAWVLRSSSNPARPPHPRVAPAQILPPLPGSCWPPQPRRAVL